MTIKQINYSKILVLKSVESPAGQAFDRFGIPEREYPKMVRSRWNKLNAEFPRPLLQSLKITNFVILKVNNTVHVT